VSSGECYKKSQHQFRQDPKPNNRSNALSFGSERLPLKMALNFLCEFSEAVVCPETQIFFNLEQLYILVAA
jgi:hypothetical protein